MGYFFRAVTLIIAATAAVPWANAQSVSFVRLRALGDSLTINTQGGMVSDYRTQVKGWVPLLAKQIGTEMKLPLLEQMSLIGQQRRQDYPDYQHTHCLAYNGVSTDDTFMKVAPEIPWISFGWAYNHLDLILADRPGYTMVQAIKEDDPTFVVGFLGSNDFMERVMATGTMLEGLPLMGLAEEISPLDGGNMRPQDMFRSDFETVVSTLYKPGVGMCFGTLPVLPDIPGIMNKQELTEFVGPNSLPDDCYTNYTVAACVRGGLKGTDAFADDRNYYTPAELQSINDAINGYNTTIRNAGANPAHPFCVVETPIQDPGTMDGSIHVNGWQVNNQIFTANLGKPRASIMTTDGVHMTDIGNALCANRYIRAINAYYGTSIPVLNEAQLTDILNKDTFADNDADGKIEGISCGVFFLTLNFVYPDETGDSNEVPRNAKVLTTGTFPASAGRVERSIEGPEYFDGTGVTLTASPDGSTGAVFSHWEGDVPAGGSNQNPLAVTMNAHRNIVAVFDTAPPSITCPADKRLSVGLGICQITAADWTKEAFVSDDCSPPEHLTVTQEPLPGTQMNAADSPHTVTITAEDEVGNKNQCSFTVTVTDDEAPSITGPENKSFSAEAGTCHATARDWTGQAVVSDNCSASGNITVTQAPPPGTLLDLSASPHTVTLTARDEVGNTNQYVFTVSVMDNEAPRITGPENKNLGAEVGTCHATAQDWTGQAVVSDNCAASGNVTVTQSPPPGTLLDLSGNPHTVTLTARDESGNTNQCAFTVTVMDGEAPRITGPENKNLSAEAGTCHTAAQDWTGQAVISDNCSASGNITVTQMPPPGTELDVANSPHAVTLTARDEAGNTNQCSFTATVLDGQAPEITGPANKSLNTDVGTRHATTQNWAVEAVVSDNCSPSGQITVTQAPPPGTELDAANSPHTITLTAEDQAGNTNQCTFTVTVTDKEAPSIACPADKNLNTDSGACHAAAQDWTGEAVTSDNCSLPENITVTQTPAPGTQLDASGGPRTVTLTAEDEAGNVNQCTFTVTVMDGEAPMIVCPADKSLNADSGTCHATAQDWTGEAVASDNCSMSENMAMTQTPPPGTQLAIADNPHTVTLTAKDEAGNTSQCNFSVTVTDNKEPSILCPADKNLNTDMGTCHLTAADWTGEAVVSGNCTAFNDITLAQEPPPGTPLAAAGSPYTVTLTAEDKAGSTIRCSFIVSVTDNEAPSIICPENKSLSANAGECFITAQDWAGEAVISDNCSAPRDIIVTQTPPPGARLDAGGSLHSVTLTAKDKGGNTSQCSFSVTVMDNATPCVVTVPDVVGQTLTLAGTTLIGASLATGVVTEQCSNTVAAGAVISQSPSAETQAAFGSTVALVVSTGMCGVTVPDVVGQAQTAANTALTGANLTTGTVTEQCSNTVAAGAVISQDPAAESQAAFGSAVALVVSTGVCNVTVPNVAGQTLSAAGTTLTAANLTTGTVTEQCSDTVAAGLVISQDPAAESQAAFGSAVALVVSTGVCNVTVPNVTGQTLTAAGTALAGANLTTGTVTEQCSDTVAAGLIISQNPAADSQAPLGGPVALVVSTGMCNVTVPNVADQTLTAAGTTLAGANLYTGTVIERCGNTVAAGLVISQYPAAGTQAAFGSHVTLVLSTGACSVTVPNVTGQTLTAAGTALTGANLNTGTVTEQCSDTVAAGLVISQIPAAGGQASFDSAVTLVVSTGVCSVIVPNVLGQTQAAATAAIETSGFALGTVTEDFSDTVPAGSVMAQTPSGGAEAAPGSEVSLVISQGAGTTIPNVLGMTRPGAESAILGANLLVGQVTDDFSDTVPAGQVLSQNPEGGTEAARGVFVNFVMSLGPKTTVPAVMGLSLADAQVALAAAGLVVQILEEANADVPAGQLIRQEPAEGTAVARGSTVNLIISTGPPDTDSGCAGCRTGTDEITLGSLSEVLADLFLVGLGTMVLTDMHRTRD